MRKILTILFLVLIPIMALDPSKQFDSINDKLDYTYDELVKMSSDINSLDSKIVQVYDSIFKFDVFSIAFKVFTIISHLVNWIVVYIIVFITTKRVILNSFGLIKAQIKDDVKKDLLKDYDLKKKNIPKSITPKEQPPITKSSNEDKKIPTTELEDKKRVRGKKETKK